MPRQLINPEIFQAAASETRLRPRTREAARRYLVDGITQQAAAAEARVDRAQVGRAVASIKRRILGWGKCPFCGNERTVLDD